MPKTRKLTGTPLAQLIAMTLTVIAGSANVPLAKSLAAALRVKLHDRIVERFADGELHVEIEESVRGHDVYVIQPTAVPVDEHLMELFFLADACRRAGAARVTAVLPYFGYARQDRRASGREPVGARVIAGLIEAAGIARVVAIDLHTPEIEGFFHIPLEHLSATKLLADAVRPTSDMVIVAPDLGAVKLAERYQAFLHAPVVVLHKARVSGSEVSLRSVIGDVRDRAPLIVDDMISTAATIETAVKGLLAAGCMPDVSVVATHGVFVGPAVARLQALHLRQLIVTNSVDIQADLGVPLQVVSLAPMIADTIARLNRDESLEHLLVHV